MTTRIKSALVGHWPLNSHPQDLIGGNHGTLSGTTSYTEGPRGRSVTATGGGGGDSTAGIRVGDVAALELQIFSVAMRFKFDTLTNFRALASSVADSSWDEGWVLFYQSSLLKFRVAAAGQQATIAFTDTSKWHDVVITCDGTTLRIYLDDVEGTSDTFTAPVDYTDAEFVLGGSWNTAAVSGAHKGKISDARIYNVVLTAAEMLELGRMGVPKQHTIRRSSADGPDSSLVLQTLIPDATDMSGNGNDGTPTDVILGNGGEFNGSSSEIDLNKTLAELGVTNDFTISLWMNTNTIAASTGTFIFFDTGGPNGFFVRRETANLSIKLSDWGATVSNVLTVGKQHFVVLVLNGTSGSLYLDGTLVASQSGITVDLPSTDGFIGSASGGNFFAGNIEDVRIFNEAKSAAWDLESYLRERKYH